MKNTIKSLKWNHKDKYIARAKFNSNWTYIIFCPQPCCPQLGCPQLGFRWFELSFINKNKMFNEVCISNNLTLEEAKNSAQIHYQSLVTN